MFHNAPCGMHPAGTIPKCDACTAMEKAKWEHMQKLEELKLSQQKGQL
jgi:hypothetical protein